MADGKLASYGNGLGAHVVVLADARRGRIELVHVNVPEQDFAGVSQGGEKYYWTPWHDYLIGKTPSP